MRRAVVVSLFLLCGSCQSEADPFVVRVRGPLEGSLFAASANVELRVRNEDGSERSVGRLSPRDTSFEVPESAKSGVGSLSLAGLASDGAIVEYGRTPSLELSGLTGRAIVNLSILVQRTRSIADTFKLDSAIAAPRCAAIGARYAVIADASSLSADVIDLLDLTVRREEAFDVKPALLATAGPYTVAIDETGAAIVLDIDSGTTTKLTNSLVDLVGGSVIHDDVGGAWIVGATRTTTPSDMVLRLDPAGTFSTKKLLVPRSSAAATWVNGRGLVIAYGSSAKMDESGVEILAPGAATSAATPFPADHRPGGVIAAIDPNRILRLDEDGVGTTLDLSCASMCMPAPSTVKDDKRARRPDDHATPLEGGSSLIVRGGRVLLLEKESLTLLHDARDATVCSAAIGTGSAVVMVAGEARARTVAPKR